MREKTVSLLPLSNLMENLCLSTACSGNCEQSNCLIGFWFNLLLMSPNEIKESLKRQKIQDFLPPNTENIYEKDIFLKCQTIVLLQCASCQEEHMESCILSVLRTTFHYFITRKWEDEPYYYRNMMKYLRHMIRENRADGVALLNYCRQYKKSFPVAESNLRLFIKGDTETSGHQEHSQFIS